MEDLARLAAAPRRLVIGLQSGTSVDGLDAALVELDGARPRARLVHFRGEPFDPALRERILAARLDAPPASAAALAALHFDLGRAYAGACEALLAEVADPACRRADLVASPGQTIYHLPRADGGPLTLQVGEASVVAERLRLPVVTDFRVRDVAAGGDGAPLVPYADRILFAAEGCTRAVVNIGGIANVTVLVGDDPATVTGFDTGPGNVLIDEATRLATGGRQTFDEDGRIARVGRVDGALLAALLAHPYLARTPPRSTDRRTFGPHVVEAARRGHPDLAAADLIRTFVRFTADSIAGALQRFAPPVDEVLVGGGGASNPVLMEDLDAALRPVPVRTTDAAGVPSKAREAMAFAILADATVRGIPGNVPAVTGAARPVILGKVIPP